MDWDWQRLADYLKREMVRHGWTSQKQFAKAAGVGERLIGDLIAARGFKAMPYKLSKIEDALDWPPGTARRILEGRDVDVPRRRDPFDDADQPYERRRVVRREMYNALGNVRNWLNEARISDEQREDLLARIDAVESRIDWAIDQERAESDT